MPSKKKKYNSRFPPARIKKIMQTDEDVGKVAAAVPVIISRALELFIESLILKSSETTKSKNAKTLSTAHMKQTILSEKKFDFLKDLVANIPDVQPNEDEGEGPSTPAETSAPKPRGRPRKKASEDGATPEPKKRGRKRKQDEMAKQENSDTEDADTDTANDDEDEEEEEEEDSENDSTESNSKYHQTPPPTQNEVPPPTQNEGRGSQGEEADPRATGTPSYLPDTLPTPTSNFPFPRMSGQMGTPMNPPDPLMALPGYPGTTTHSAPPYPHPMAAAGMLPRGMNSFSPMTMGGYPAGLPVPPGHHFPPGYSLPGMYPIPPANRPLLGGQHPYWPSTSGSYSHLASESQREAPNTATDEDYDT